MPSMIATQHISLMNLSKAFFVVGAALALTGCMVGPDFNRPSTKTQQSYDAPGKTEFTVATKLVTDQALNPVQWWAGFKDPILVELLTRASKQNLSLQSAAVRVFQARSQLGVSDATLLPTVGLNGSTTRADQSNIYSQLLNGSMISSTTNVALQAAWELDFWGKLRRGIESSTASYYSSAAAFYAADVSLASDVANTYINIRNNEQLIQVAKTNLALQLESLRIAQARYQYGATSLLDLSQAQSQYEQTKSQIPIFIGTLRKYEFAMSILLGETPDFYAKHYGQTQGSLVAPAELQVAIPTDLLRRRPDVRQAEFVAAAQSALIGVNTAALYPAFSLSGVFGFQTSAYGGVSQGSLFSWDNRLLSGGGTFTFPVFYRGAIVDQIRVQDAVFQQSVLTYQNLVLQAQREVDDALVVISTTRSSIEDLARAVTAAQQAARLALDRYKAGQADYNTVILAQQQLLQVQDSFVQTQANNLLGYVAAFKALGGGWSGQLDLPKLPEQLVEQMQQSTDWGSVLTSTTDPRLVKSSETIK